METATLIPASDCRPDAAISTGSAPRNAPPSPTESFADQPFCALETRELPMRFTSGSHYAYSSESFSLKYRSADGDTLELTSKRESFQMTSWRQGEIAEAGEEGKEGENGDAAGMATRADGLETEAMNPDGNQWDKLHGLMQRVKNEMQEQQRQLLQALFGWEDHGDEGLQGLWAKLAAARETGMQAGTQGAEEGGEGKGLEHAQAAKGFSLKLTVEEFHLKVELQAGEGASLADGDYWNAENTSDRIVNFAMQFAGLEGDDSDGFAAKIHDAIELGFAQAVAITGPLPGSAGKLTEDTHRLTFEKLAEKLDARLAARLSAPYTPEVLPVPGA